MSFGMDPQTPQKRFNEDSESQYTYMSSNYTMEDSPEKQQFPNKFGEFSLSVEKNKSNETISFSDLSLPIQTQSQFDTEQPPHKS